MIRRDSCQGLEDAETSEGLHASPRIRPSQVVCHDSGTGILEDVALIRLVLALRDAIC